MSAFREYVVKPLMRASGWWRVRSAHIARQPECACCGRATKLEVHHIKDFSNNPALELEPSNLVTLCRNGTQCHLAFGHLGNWKRANEHVIDDAAYMSQRYAAAANAERRRDGDEGSPQA